MVEVVGYIQEPEVGQCWWERRPCWRPSHLMQGKGIGGSSCTAESKDVLVPLNGVADVLEGVAASGPQSCLSDGLENPAASMFKRWQGKRLGENGVYLGWTEA